MSAFEGKAVILADRSLVSKWHIASFRSAAEIGCHWGIADSGGPSARQIYGVTA